MPTLFTHFCWHPCPNPLQELRTFPHSSELLRIGRLVLGLSGVILNRKIIDSELLEVAPILAEQAAQYLALDVEISARKISRFDLSTSFRAKSPAFPAAQALPM